MKFFWILFTIFVLNAAGFAQGKDDVKAEPESYKLKRGEKEITFEYGISPLNPSNFMGPKEFNVYGRDLHLFDFRVGRVIGTKKNVITFQYEFGVSPLAIFYKNEVKNPYYVSAAATPNVKPTIRQTSYGVGVQPVGFRFIFFPNSRLKPFAQANTGVLITNKPIPVPRSRTLNFTGDFGGGLQYHLSRERAVSIGYRYFHISNGNIGGKINNPGYNANIFYINYSFFFK